MKAGSLGCHLADVHDIYQQTVVAKDIVGRPTPRNIYSQHGAAQQRPAVFLPRMRGPTMGWLDDAATLQG
jgi:hypothetical protein